MEVCYDRATLLVLLLVVVPLLLESQYVESAEISGGIHYILGYRQFLPVKSQGYYLICGGGVHLTSLHLNEIKEHTRVPGHPGVLIKFAKVLLNARQKPIIVVQYH